jgi:hypothetical protein
MFSLTIFESLQTGGRTEGEAQLLQLNETLRTHGLRLTRQNAAEILENRNRILKGHGRVELDLSVTKKLIVGLAASAFMTQEAYLAAFYDLYEVFHDLKNTLSDFIGDDELIEAILVCLERNCGGSSELLLGKGIENIISWFEAGRGRQDFPAEEEETLWRSCL